VVSRNRLRGCTDASQIGAQVSTAQLEKIESYVEIGRDEGAEVLIGGNRAHLGGELEGGYYFQPTARARRTRDGRRAREPHRCNG
jgi:acyl-CoA reductase-like NAD-dependent aldehyde dehydrogenase